MNKLVVLYGSQTGNAQDLAERIWKRAKQHGIPAKLSSFNSFDMNVLDEQSALVGVCSTTGQGDVPDNMLAFWRLIMRKGLPPGCLQHVRFSVVGLGDSSYDKYNFTAKKLFKRFSQLGAQPLTELCLCDEQHSDGTEGTYSKWAQTFWPLIVDLFPATSKDSSDSKQFIYKYRISYLLDVEPEKSTGTEPDHRGAATESKPFRARLLKNDRVTSKDHFQNVRLVQLDCKTDRISYEAGDVLMMRPSNLKENTRKFMEVFEHLNLDVSKRIKIESNFPDEIDSNDDSSLGQVHTVGELIENYLDINSIPRMSFFETFSKIADDETEKEKLEEFLTPQGLEDLYNYCYRPRRTIMEIFYDFSKTSRSISSLDVLLELIPGIKPRAFSIASSPTVHKDRVEVLVAVVEYKTRLFESRKGTCSYWLSTLDPAQSISIPVWIKKGSFVLDKPTSPIIYIGPGTGVAPFRSLINERIARHTPGGNYLYFGCRNRLSDYYFEEEWTKLARENPESLRVYPAFSRDQAEKIYVQDLLLANSSEVFSLLNESSATVLIAGNSKRMPQDVMAILEKIIKANLTKSTLAGEDSEEHSTSMAREYIKKLELVRRIQMETWG